MTSGQFTSFPIESVWVNRDKRQRRELNKIEELATSIARNGLINPIVIRRDGELVAGERRWTAIRSLGWTHLSVQFIEDLSELEVHAIELEENIRRVDLSWQDQCRAVEEYHQLRMAQEPEWTALQTADALGISSAEITEKRQVAQELARGNARVTEAPKYSTARSIVQRETQRRKASVLADVAEPGVEAVTPAAPLLNEDFHDWAAAYTGIRFNFIHCDFPYGVGMHNSDQGGGAAFGTYQDDVDTYWKLLNTLESAMSNVVADSAHLMFWFSMDYYQRTLETLTMMGWRVNPFPLIWHKSDNVGIIPDAKRGPRRIYETAFFASRGDRWVAQPISNLCSAPSAGKEIHSNQKPQAMLRHFLRMFVDENSVVLDPTCGSASALKAARALGAPTVLGLERDPEFYELAKGAFFDDALSL